MRLSPKIYRGRYQFLMDSLPAGPISVLDVGNLGDGDSFCSDLQKEMDARGGTYSGLDSNVGLTEKLKLPRQVVGDLHAAPFEDETFDAIYAGEIIEHTWTPALMIQECRRILKPGGKLILDTPNAFSLMPMLRYLFKKTDSMGDNRVLVYHEAKSAFSSLKEKGDILLQPQHKIFFSPAMMRQLLQTQGYVLESVGFTAKPSNILHRLLLWMFPQTGQHLCVVARKASVDEAFADVADKSIIA
jgi:ubiquinone/menaquinone biosynthesis C-methylase UbiE